MVVQRITGVPNTHFSEAKAVAHRFVRMNVAHSGNCRLYNRLFLFNGPVFSLVTTSRRPAGNRGQPACVARERISPKCSTNV